ncbi:hypothetical protein GCM10012320_31940 [Sinomonas cellulolyticus]|uniref:hypothetical protein n=1 Tax=Sinomonas cellulolyticus TaxID=2801916 RepID=UPI0019B67C3D|nr:MULTISPECIES: hypothetical protein [Sinomonas]GHG58297.1 hypothetical protein GCM10012320_31940 [Sinomonas sp. KCTC 49339]
MARHPTSFFGRLFAAGFGAVKAVRPDRPIHPQGVLLTGTLEISGGGSGIPFLDAASKEAVTARLSRSIGLPVQWPDIIGLAVRFPAEGRTADVLLASTGWRVPGRFCLTMHRTAGAARLTSLMPYRGPRGPVILGARTRGADPGAPGRISPNADWHLELFWATPLGAWHRFGSLRLRPALGPDGTIQDTSLRFDPLLSPLPTAGTYAWTRRLREHSYRRARS